MPWVVGDVGRWVDFPPNDTEVGHTDAHTKVCTGWGVDSGAEIGV